MYNILIHSTYTLNCFMTFGFTWTFIKVYGVDDELLKEKVRSIPRDDVAEVCLQSLVHEDAVNRSFDIISKEPVENTEPTTNWKAWFSMNKGTCKY